LPSVGPNREVGAGAAEIGGVGQDGVDHDGRARVPPVHLEADPVPAVQHVAAGQLASDAAALLVHDWRRLADLHPAHVDNQRAGRIDAQAARAGVVEPSQAGIDSRGERDVELEFTAATAVVGDVDAVVHVAIDDPRVLRDVSDSADHVVADARQPANRRDPRAWVRSNELDTEDGLRPTVSRKLE
jgi:hypothetical protein